eukprot:TRINITY_DN9442_c0_g11_i1.p1 TRINITY_DN9442_c0_g11~~TRINITY_DN9442_c0_g11_i1.p1  ORF type:complete len:361 (+),score=68.36 TRINITY_DN9442_c0_g11_i1:284-1366(+)
MVFGYGYETWEWTIATPIRSTLHPFLYAIGYWFLSIFSLDTGFLVAYLPRLIQGALLALTDYYVYKLTKETFQDRLTAQIALLLHLSSWFVNFAMVRTLSNSVETTLILIIYYYWTKLTPVYSEHDTVVAVLYTLTFFLRATSGIVIATLVFAQIFRYGLLGLKNLFKSFFIGAVPVIILVISLDSWYYGSFQIPMVSFLRVNVLEGISANYGTHSTYWYFFAAVPLLTLTYLPFVLHGFVRTMHSLKECTFLYVVMVYMTLMSMLAHKEERQILPVLPFLIILAAYSLATIKKRWNTLGIICMGVAISVQVVFLLLANSFYRVGSLAVMDELRAVPSEELPMYSALIPCLLYTSPSPRD